MNIANLFEEQDEQTMSLWHGGRGLQFTYDEMLPPRKGRWKYGTGLYLTSHYETAVEYAKGGGSVYLVTIKKGTDINNIRIPIDEAIEFVHEYVIKKFKTPIIDDLKNNASRRNSNEVGLVVLANLCLNYESLSSANVVNLRKFIVKKGADYEIVNHFKGRNETIVVVFNPKIIKSVKIKKSKDVTSDERIMPVIQSV